ncbi:hypothetical protein [Rhodococcus sp. IEGM 1330]|uniref:hypothetical protein n=1 Tax=Rhodococcus sp. IEGM 1330 TaxID=3082225 RepID=UPI00295419DA|nr:hypothetical protein [Rhodococcus sp. IEGM 1330]MDV8022010.1 hypothetical protein [Rhodococcus sp. IEGM 1330]
MPLPETVKAHYLGQQRLTMELLAYAEEIWGSRPPADFDAWFAANVDDLVQIMTIGQQRATRDIDDYVTATLDEAGTPVTPEADLITDSLAGTAADGRSLDGLFYGAVVAAGKQVETKGSALAWQAGFTTLQMYMQTQLADATRVATKVAVATRPGVGSYRMLNPPSCSRCVVLAGRFYRWNAAFRRHPGCDCKVVAAVEGTADDAMVDPVKYFDSLSVAEQNKTFTMAGAEAIRSGADIGQVVNVRRGATGLDSAAGSTGALQTQDVYGQQLFTSTEGVTKRGVAGNVIRARGRDPRTTPRLMPESIMEIAESREDALRLLRANGYILDRSGPASGVGSRTSLVPDIAKPVRPIVDLDAVAAAEAAKRAAHQKKVADTKAWLEAERLYEESRPLSRATRDLITSARADLPAGQDGWDNLSTLSKDANGAFVPSRRLKAHLTTVTDAGRAINTDIARRMNADDALTSARALLSSESVAAERDRLLSAGNFQDLLKFDTVINARRVDVAKRESEIILEALTDARGFGGTKQTVRTLTPDDRAKIGEQSSSTISPVDADALDMLREAERFYPTDWLRAADDRGPIGLGHADRGFFLEQHPSVLTTDTIVVSKRGSHPYEWGAHADEATETMIHELGHRMEKSIPGLTQLEFALARTRATRNGLLETPAEMYPGSGEMTYKDDWTERSRGYTGKTYEAGIDRPDLKPHEIFQTGTQDLYGRSQFKFGDTELQEFMLGVLTLL